MSSHHETLEQMYERHNRERQEMQDRHEKKMKEFYDDHDRKLKTAMLAYAAMAVIGTIMILIG